MGPWAFIGGTTFLVIKACHNLNCYLRRHQCSWFRLCFVFVTLKNLGGTPNDYAVADADADGSTDKHQI